MLNVRLNQQTPIPLDVDITCGAGELLALIGPSGSGKTTVLRAIAGLNRPQSGTIRCNGDTWFSKADDQTHWVTPQDRHVGLVFQDYALFPHLSAQDNVAMALGHIPRPDRATRAQSLLATVHLAGLEDRRPEHLSGGQRQRVALARALARDPRALLLDEPFSAVDQMTRQRLQRELATLRQTVNVPIILVTHDISEALALADQICVLHRGTSLQQADPETISLKPANRTVARLMGQSNVFDGMVLQTSTPTEPGKILSFDHTFEVADTGDFQAGAAVTWLVPTAHIVMHRRGRPSLGERENPLTGTVKECTVLGETLSVTLHVDEHATSALNFTIPLHVARRNGIAPGVEMGVSLLADGIHLMPPEPGRSVKHTA